MPRSLIETEIVPVSRSLVRVKGVLLDCETLTRKHSSGLKTGATQSKRAIVKSEIGTLFWTKDFGDLLLYRKIIPLS